MKTMTIGSCLILLLLILNEACASEVTDVATSAQDIRPLSVGMKLPSLTLQGVDGEAFDLNKAIKSQHTILIFYRGGWCPYCNRHLGQLQTIESKLRDLGYQILAISADRPGKLAESIDKHKLTYTLLSDHAMKAARSFGIAFRVDDATIEKYKGYGINLEESSGQKHHLLPVPSVFIVGTDSVIKFSYVNPDYKVRLAPEDLLKAAQIAAADATNRVEQIFLRVREHEFHPVRNGFTFDCQLNKHGVADLQDTDWLVRTLAVRDLVRLGQGASAKLLDALHDTNVHVRHVAAMVLGITRDTSAVSALEDILRSDSDSVVRSQAAIALGQIGNKESLETLRHTQAEDKSSDVQHHAELAAYALEHGFAATAELTDAYRSLNEIHFSKVHIDEPAVDFELPDTAGRLWRLSDFRGKKPVVLIWIFADWCPVCHGEFRELIELHNQFEEAGVQVFTLECHDMFRSRVMVGKELEPKYWFSKTSFKDDYTKNIWWPHLVDRAAAVGTEYGVQPMAFVVHSEWINRPSVIVVDKEGIVRFAYYGTYWGDRPGIQQVLEMVRSNRYQFESNKRLKSKSIN